MTFGVSIGEDCVIAATARFIGPVTLGDRVTVCDGAVIGSAGDHRQLAATTQMLTIGDDTIIREHVVIHRGVAGTSRRFWGTKIGKNCYLMAGTLLEHDTQLGDDVTLSPYVVLAGHTVVLDGANLGIAAATHQGVTIGANAMVGMHATVLHDVPPGAKVVGSPAKVIGVNTVGIKRSGYGKKRMASLALDYELLAGDRPPMKVKA